VHAVFSVLDPDNGQSISKQKLQDYLRPFVMAMSPPAAEALRPILLRKAVDDIYREMNLDRESDVSSEEFLAWTSKGNSIIDRLADLIDKEVYQIWLSAQSGQAPAEGAVPQLAAGGAPPPKAWARALLTRALVRAACQGRP